MLDGLQRSVQLGLSAGSLVAPVGSSAARPNTAQFLGGLVEQEVGVVGHGVSRHHHSSLQPRPLSSRKCLDNADSIDEKATVSVANFAAIGVHPERRPSEVLYEFGFPRLSVLFTRRGAFFRRFIVRTSAGGFSLPSASNSKRLSPTSIEKKPAGTLSSCSGSSIRFLRFTRVFLSVTCALWSYALSTARPVGLANRRRPEACRRHHFRTSRDSKRVRWRSHRGSRAIRRRPASEIGLAWLTARNSNPNVPFR
jgi:hypothetical protein